MKSEEFLNKQYEKSKVDYGLAPPPTTSLEAINVLSEHFLGKDWYMIMPVSQEQAITVIVAEILEKTQPKNFFQRLFNF
jgi:hypothetical protein